MEKDGSVTFEDWQKGQAKHPIYGNGLLQNVEVFENKGIASLKNFVANNNSSYTYSHFPVAKVEDFYLTGDSTGGDLTRYGSVLATGLTNAYDMVMYKDYIWVRYGANLGAYGPISDAPQWFGGILTSFSLSGYGKIIVGQDSFLFSGSGNEVVKLEVTAFGVPAVAPTVVVNTTLDLKDGQYTRDIDEYGTKIVIGTEGEGSSSAINAKLYGWNRQAGTLGNPGLADLPVPFQETRINSVLSHQNKLYVSAGTSGNIYMTDSTNYVKITSLPYCENTIFDPSIVYPNAMAISSRGTLLIGLSALNVGTSTGARYGVYEVDINDPSYPVSFFTLGSQVTSPDFTFSIGFLEQDNSTLSIGYQQGEDFGVDSTAPYLGNGYNGIIETKLTKVGGYNRKKTFEFIGFDFASALTNSQFITISYRSSVSEDWVSIGSWGNSVGGDTTEIGSIASFEDKFGSIGVEYIQLKIELASSDLVNNMQLISVKIW